MKKRFTSAKTLEWVLRSQHDAPTLEQMREMILDMVAANARENDELPFERGTIMPLIRAYNDRMATLREHEEKEPLTLLGGAEAEKLWWECVEEGYRHAVRRFDGAFNPECVTWWPDYLDHTNGLFSPLLIKEIAGLVGYIDGRRDIAMRDYFLAEEAKKATVDAPG